MYTSAWLLAGGGAAVIASALLVRQSNQTKSAVENAVAGTGPGEIKLRLTTYWPSSATEGERKMEGGLNDRKGRPLRTLEDFLAGRSDHVSLSGDDAAWPYGQKLLLFFPDGKTIVGRVTDTGRNFRGSTKVYRAFGNEPIDVCVGLRSTKVPPFVTAKIVVGDTLDKSQKTVAVEKFQGQTVVVGGLHTLGASSNRKEG